MLTLTRPLANPETLACELKRLQVEHDWQEHDGATAIDLLPIRSRIAHVQAKLDALQMIVPLELTQ